jgi:hypothetical protein
MVLKFSRLSHQEIIDLSRSGVAKVDMSGWRGATQCTAQEIQAMAFMISSMDALPSPTALNEIAFSVLPQTVLAQGDPIEGKFLAREGTVRFKPDRIKCADRFTSISIGFPVLSLDACVQDRKSVAFQIAALLNQNQTKELQNEL